MVFDSYHDFVDGWIFKCNMFYEDMGRDNCDKGTDEGKEHYGIFKNVQEG